MKKYTAFLFAFFAFAFHPFIAAAGNDANSQNSTTSLQLGLLSFTATVTDGQFITVDWETASETNNDFFTLEKTTDGISFSQVAIVDGAGTSSQPRSYSVRDESPSPGVSYYRLKTTDINGVTDSSGFVAVEFSKGLSFVAAVFPNPSAGAISLAINGGYGKTFSVIITDAFGYTMLREEIVPASDAAVYAIGRSLDLQSGVYTINVISENEVSSSKFMIHKQS